MEAIILAGGMGTRLKSLYFSGPKPMAPVAGRPFIEYNFNWLISNGINKIIIATGYKGDVIKSYYGYSFQGVPILYSDEDTPLGTGGAIKRALALCEGKNVLAMNGDSFFGVNVQSFYKSFRSKSAKLAVAVKYLENTGRYGTVIINRDVITDFKEKKSSRPGFVSGGIYIMKHELLNDYDGSFSFENDVLEKMAPQRILRPFVSDAFMIDIGVPEDYQAAQMLEDVLLSYGLGSARK